MNPTFSLTYSGNSCPEYFIKSFSKYVSAMGWNDRKAIRWLFYFLEGEAEEWFLENCQNEVKFESAIAKLQQSFKENSISTLLNLNISDPVELFEEFQKRSKRVYGLSQSELAAIYISNFKSKVFHYCFMLYFANVNVVNIHCSIVSGCEFYKARKLTPFLDLLMLNPKGKSVQYFSKLFWERASLLTDIKGKILCDVYLAKLSNKTLSFFKYQRPVSLQNVIQMATSLTTESVKEDLNLGPPPKGEDFKVISHRDLQAN